MNSSTSNVHAQSESESTGRRITLWTYLAGEKISSFMWIIRIYTFILCLQYLFLGYASSMAQSFQKAMIANAVVCALRLHQRIPQFRFSREHLGNIFQEDSAHYMLFSFIFLSTYPSTIALIPIGLFALLHVCSFTRQLLNAIGVNIAPLQRFLNYIAKHQVTLFRIVALNEAIAFPILISMVFSGQAPLYAPFLYFKFVQCRYVSRRNPYSRIVFYELRYSLEQLSLNPSCPRFVASMFRSAINVVSKMSPPVAN